MSAPEPSPLFLLGFMGAGKTTLGRALEARLPGWRYIDLDEEIERHAGMSVAKFFSVFGEDAFRRAERKALEEVAAIPRAIIGCGGGTPCFFDNMELMNTRGRTIFLRASKPVLLRRLLEAQAQRPKLNGFSPQEVDNFIEETLRRRSPHYSKARYSFPSDRLETPAEIEATCRMFIRLYLPGEA